MKYLKNTETNEVQASQAFGPDYYNGNLGDWVEATETEYNTYIAPTERIKELKVLLADTDYQSLKAAEGVPSDDWETIKVEREAYREEIRTIEGA